MPLFKVIQAEADLPQEHGAAERMTFDLKGNYKRPFDHEEMAKDVAAFANAIGGVVLVGAHEDEKHGVLGRYRAFAQVEANELKREVSQAVRDHCSPTPLVDPAVVPLKDAFVVAVNVWAFPGQAVGVRVEGTQDAYRFPLRTAVDTTFIQPEQLAMLMVPEVRRKLILLDAIETDARVHIIVPNPSLASGEPIRLPFEFVRADARRNVVVLTDSAHGPIREVLFPLDQVRSIWQEGERVWAITLEGRVIWGSRGFQYSPY